jgi:hypothetical protein
MFDVGEWFKVGRTDLSRSLRVRWRGVIKNRLHVVPKTIVAGMLLSLIWCLPAYSNESGGGKWEFQLAPYAWLSGLKGEVPTLSGL